ncbi:MAG: O-phosphoserine--tRNA ligase [Candidatus Hydrothermarchaeales archaeon]
MGKWNSKKISELAKEDFETTWLDTKKLIDPMKGKGIKKISPGKPHPVFATIDRLRDAYLKLGFSEVINPLYVEDTEVRKQFGPEAAAVLDRCYYLGGLPRPDVGLSDETIALIKELGAEITDKKAISDVLHRYKKGEFGGDDLAYTLASVLKVDDSKAMKIINEVFPEFKELEPESTRNTLRSHMTSGWFLTLETLIDMKSFPIQLFSIDRCFRREQREDESHLRTYHSASCVVVDEEVGVEAGKEVSTGLLKQFGFKDFKFKPDEKRSKYYTPDTQTEVYARHPKGGWVEIATFGIYSPVALSRYKIEYPVMNLGLGVERLTMVLYGVKDARELVYPQFYSDWKLTDEDIASRIFLDKMPSSKEGKEIVDRVIAVGQERGESESPCEFEVYNGKVSGSNVTVKLVEIEDKTKLLGPAAFNSIYVHKGNIYGISEKKGSEEVRKGGINTGVTYIEGIANLAAYNIEKAGRGVEKKSITKVKIARNLNDINLRLDSAALRYITANNKNIDIRGPVFMTIEARIGE